MDDPRLIAVLSALGQRTRLDVYRRVVAAGHDGVQTGVIAEALQMPVNYLATHLQTLVAAGLIAKHVRGRTARYVVDERTAGSLVPAISAVLATPRTAIEVDG